MHDAERSTVTGRRAVYFVSDSTGITAEMLGNALLANFPGLDFERRTVPFVETVEAATALVRAIEATDADEPPPLVFLTVKSPEVRTTITRTRAESIDLLAGHLAELEQVLGTGASEHLARYHGIGDPERYHERMRAVEFAIEHDDGQSLRMLDTADVVLVAPSRCGKTPTSMYLALQHGLRVANYPLTDDDLPAGTLPAPIAGLVDRCFGITSTPARLSQVRNERRPGSRYASLEQCRRELRFAEDLFRRHRIAFMSSATTSVEEMATVILQTLKRRA